MNLDKTKKTLIIINVLYFSLFLGFCYFNFNYFILALKNISFHQSYLEYIFVTVATISAYLLFTVISVGILKKLNFPTKPKLFFLIISAIVSIAAIVWAVTYHTQGLIATIQEFTYIQQGLIISHDYTIAQLINMNTLSMIKQIYFLVFIVITLLALIWVYIRLYKIGKHKEWLSSNNHIVS